MATKQEPWFVGERSEAIAGLLLTSREDVNVRHARNRDLGPDFVVDVGGRGTLPAQPFVVQVVGTMSSDPKDWAQDVKQLFSSSKKADFYPSCVFVINVRDNTAFYAWLIEPLGEKIAARLIFHNKGEFHPLDKDAVSDIIDRVKSFYKAKPRACCAL